MPIEQVGTDAAILFSDILVIPQAFGYEVQMIPGRPFTTKTVNNLEDARAIKLPDVHQSLGYVMDAITLTRKNLDGRVPLIGFAGAPFTIPCCIARVKDQKTFHKPRRFVIHNEKQPLLLQNYDLTIQYLNAQIQRWPFSF